MTAIALLDAENSPYLIADTLVSVETADPNPEKKIWLPALGSINSEWGTPPNLWHISRLARKTYFLPNSSGVLAFSGNCAVAADFLRELSRKFLTSYSYDRSLRISRQTIEDSLQNSSRVCEFSLLGVLARSDGSREAFTHNVHSQMDTINYGKCYTAGSGAELIANIITSVGNQKLREHLPISPTEDLAELISSQMLFRERNLENGHAPGTPIDLGCGGFYEWYAIRENGPHSMPPRIDIHVNFDEGRLYISRLHFSEQMESSVTRLIGSSLPSQDYSLIVYNFGLHSTEIPLNIDVTNEIKYMITQAAAVFIESIFKPNLELKGNPRPRMSGLLTPDLVAHLFDEEIEVRRARITVSALGHTVQDATISTLDAPPQVTIGRSEEKICISLGVEILETIIDALAHLAQNNSTIKDQLLRSVSQC
ncbi:hypothetical protein SAMN05216198_1375 [Halopseudomonas litoralis]|uniref:Uncharacterized protein n=1 Tax=Halopseudomonas litoralis TaxID=797277 RepID=A0A1H1Q4L1_9GAMM|nr:hypothetical protein [Halopseudomonas litoralis]SDS18187.1 hypothetical protein SAMN05216198_1375 [Halopseudomonas litoralis]